MNAAGPHSIRSLRVLIVDDEPDFRAILVKRLRKRNLEAIPAAGGREALNRLTEEPFDAVVLDLNMPGMCGMETLREIKKAAPSVEVIILTGVAELELAVKGMELGAFDYLLKPADVDELLYKIEDASKRKQGKEEAKALPKKASNPDRT
ncbi:MAG: response regulator [Deltaproteobacteria bacterium]